MTELRDDQIVRAANKLCYEGRCVDNPLLAAAAEILCSPYYLDRQVPGASNGAMRACVYVPPHIPGKKV